MIKTLLFGAGAGSKIFIENESHTREFLAYIDNDSSKHNSKHNGLLIIAPSDIKNYDYDEIVITTQWAKEVKKQLLAELKIAPEKVIMPAKSLLKRSKPFQDDSTKALAKKIIKTISKHAIKNEIALTVDFGTLLGIIRDNNIIAWDDDVDFAICCPIDKNVEQLIFTSLAEIDDTLAWNVSKLEQKNSKVISLLIKFDETKKYKPFITSITLREEKDNYSIHMASLGQWFAPSKHFSKTQPYTWQDSTILVPYEHESYLEFVYGNWREPKKDMTFEDYNNMNEVSSTEVQNKHFTVKEVNR